MEKVAPYLKNTGFLCGDKLTIADFWIGGLYTNFMNHSAIGYGATEWAAAKLKYPAFSKYGERYLEANKAWYSSRPVMFL